MHGKKQRTSQEKQHRAVQAEFNFGYYYRTVEEQLNAFAVQEGNPYSITDIALRVGRLLEAKALREEFGTAQLVPEVRQNSTAVGRRTKTKSGEHDRLTQTKVHVRPRHSRSLSPEARKRIGEAKRAWWAEKREKGKGKKKRVLSPKMVAAMRRNIALGRQVRLAKQKAA